MGNFSIANAPRTRDARPVRLRTGQVLARPEPVALSPGGRSPSAIPRSGKPFAAELKSNTSAAPSPNRSTISPSLPALSIALLCNAPIAEPDAAAIQGRHADAEWMRFSPATRARQLFFRRGVCADFATLTGNLRGARAAGTGRCVSRVLSLPTFQRGGCNDVSRPRRLPGPPASSGGHR